MARAITKTFGSSKTKAVIKYFDNGEIKERTFELEGNKSERAISAHVFSKLKTRNFMLVSHENMESDNEETYSMSADSFIKHSQPCEDGKSYGHYTITSTFKKTIVTYYTADMTEHEYTFICVTTDSKLRNAIISDIEDSNILVGNKRIVEERRYMSKDDFMKYATKA
jgi:hypothetical protein